VKSEVVPDVASALSDLGREWFTSRFTRLFGQAYMAAIPAEDYVTYSQRLEDLSSFYARAAKEGRAVVFYTDDSLSDFSNPTGN
jgi:hypothetical protein